MLRAAPSLRPIVAGFVSALLVTTACTASPAPESVTSSSVTSSSPPAPEAATTTEAPSSTVDPEPATTTTTTTVPTTTEPARVWDGLDRVNVVLLGSDAGVGRIGTRTDTVIIVSIDPDSGDTAMFSIPRNLTEAPLPEGMGVWSCNCFPDIITHLWANGEWYPDAFPGPQEPSINALKGTLGLIFDMEIHYYAKVELAGFVAMIDALGGVTIDVPQRVVDEAYPHEDGGTESIVIEAGPQVLDGHTALAYGRIRRHSGDFARMHRQRCLLAAVVEHTDITDLVAGYREFSAAVLDHVQTDIPIEALGDFIELLSRVDIDRLASLRITSHNYGTSGHAGYQIYDLEQIRTDAQTLMRDPAARLETQDGDGLAATCEQAID